MNSLISKGFVSVSLLAFALAGCGKAGEAPADSAHKGVNQAPPARTSSGEAFPAGEPAPAAAAPEAESGSFGDESSAPRSAPAPASAGASRQRSAEKKSNEAFDGAAEERPGLGTTWGETRSSRVSSSPFERANPNNPFAVSSLHYNDQGGINAMLRGASLVDFQVESIPAARGMVTVSYTHLTLPTICSV